tara:strand:- start:41 stop:532 length:492 start_codon:yes stop_codon:yes gene_type:complete
VATKPNKLLNKDKKQLVFAPSSLILTNYYLPVNRALGVSLSPVFKSTLVSTITVFIVSTLFFLFFGGGSIELLLSVFSAAVVTAIALMVTVFWIIPAHHLFQKYNQVNMRNYILVGLCPAAYIPIDHYFTGLYAAPVSDTLSVALIGTIGVISFKLSFRAKNT